MKIFLDANVFVAACGSSLGGSRYLFHIAANDPTWQLLTSAYALEEARRNVGKKLPQALQTLSLLITAPELTIVHPPPLSFIEQAQGIVPVKDESLLAAALSAQADFLCTLDQKDFHTLAVKRFCRQFNLRIVLPQDIIRQWREEQR